MVLPIARTSAEAHLYMDLRPCGCGETRFARDSAVVALDDGDLATRYAGDCPRCGTPREFVFRLAPGIPGPRGRDEAHFGGDEPSQLLDPGEWLSVSDAYAGSVPASVEGLPPEQRRQARYALALAGAALDEVLKFVPHRADEVPATAFISERGRAMHAREPGRFRRTRLAALRAAYRDMVVSMPA